MIEEKVIASLSGPVVRAVIQCTTKEEFVRGSALGGFRVWDGGVEATNSRVFVRIKTNTHAGDPVIVRLLHKPKRSHFSIRLLEGGIAVCESARGQDLVKWERLEGRFPDWDEVRQGDSYDRSVPLRVSGEVLRVIAGICSELGASLDYQGGVEDGGPYFGELRPIPDSLRGWESGEILWMGILSRS